VVASLTEHAHDRVIVIALSPGEAFRAEKAFAELDQARPAAHGIRVSGTDPTWADHTVPHLVAQRVAALESRPGPAVGIVLLALGRPEEWDRLEPEGARQENYVLHRTRSLLIAAGHDPSRVLPAFLEWGEPGAASAVRQLAESGCTTVVLVPTTIPVDGVTTLVDLQRIADEARADGLNIIQLPAWGDDPGLTAALFRSVTDAASGDERD
jgi:sirohydrochlorin ferrochelatase